MSVLLPTGWTTFTGGGSDPALCGEPQDCPEPPCGPIPPITIEPEPGGGGHVPAELSCQPDGNVLNLIISGGVAPFEWATSGGSVTVTGARSATVNIGNPDYLGDFDEKVGSIAFFKPHMFTFNYLNGFNAGGSCGAQDPLVYYREVTADVRLRAYDCLKRHITELEDFGDAFLDNIQVDNTNNHDEMDNPIGDNPDDRTCTLSVDWPYVLPESPSRPLSDPDHFSVAADGCGLNDAGNASVHVTVATAGKTAIHGQVHADAPPIDEVKNVVFDIVPPGGFPADYVITRDTDFTQYIDVRTQTQVDTNCCVVPTGGDVIVTVTDAQNTVAVIVIPVVEPQ